MFGFYRIACAVPRVKVADISYNTAKIIESINKFLYRNILPHINVSMLCVLIDKRKRVIQYINCGHNLVCTMIAPNGEVEIMDGNRYPLGISSEIDIIESTMPYSYENRLMLSRSNRM